jgi:hypothetical protein
MKILLIALLLLSDTTALVDASKNAKEKRKKSSTKVITNADVKKSKGKLAERPATSTAEPAPEPEQSLTEKHAADRKKRLELEAAKAVLDKQVADLEAQLAAVEQSYYEENDLNRRDTEIVRRFKDVKNQLEAARAARAALEK